MAANKDTNESLDFISRSSQSAWQSSLSAQSGPGAQWPAEEPMCRKPFRALAIQLRQFLFFSPHHCWCWDKCSSGLLRSTLKALLHQTKNSNFWVYHFGFLFIFEEVRWGGDACIRAHKKTSRWLSRCEIIMRDKSLCWQREQRLMKSYEMIFYTSDLQK